MNIHIIPYRYQIRGNYSVWDTVAGQWLVESPGAGNNWVFVFLNEWEDDSRVNISPPLSGWTYDRFVLQVAGRIVKPEFEARHIDRVEDLTNLFKTSYEVPFGYEWVYDAEMKRRVPQQIDRLVPGKSNSWDGYLIYRVPASVPTREILLLSNLDFAAPAWRLKGGDVFSLG